jgi:hypothetical protein
MSEVLWYSHPSVPEWGETTVAAPDGPTSVQCVQQLTPFTTADALAGFIGGLKALHEWCRQWDTQACRVCPFNQAGKGCCLSYKPGYWDIDAIAAVLGVEVER